MLRIALFLLLLLVLTSCQPVAEDDPEQPDTVAIGEIGDKDVPEITLVGDLTTYTFEQLIKLQAEGAITKEELIVELTRRLSEDEEFLADVAGTPGAPGQDGISLDWLGSLSVDPVEPRLDQAYYNELDGIAYVYDGEHWQILAMDGAEGPKGDKGDPGEPGAEGAIGETGVKGEQGDKGLQGDQGIAGSPGSDGADGITGPPGEQGERGPQGLPSGTQVLTITSSPPVIANPSWSYQILVDYTGEGTLSYHLFDAPTGMTIDRKTGMLNWQVPDSMRQNGQIFSVLLTVTDSLNSEDFQAFAIEVTIPTDGTMLGNEWVAIPGGEFQMGQEATAEPVHQVTLSTYRIQKYEVSAAEYKACVEAGVCLDALADGGSYTYGAVGKENHPINGVSWYSARTYCQWLGGDLPTEAQWEYAARGTTGRTYPWGETVPSSTANNLANCAESNCYDGYQNTAPVGSFPSGATPEGLNDLAGNIWEWNLDWYGSYSSSAEVDPTGPESGSDRVLRGGSFSDGTTYVRSAYRVYNSPDGRYDLIGFRCASPAQD